MPPIHINAPAIPSWQSYTFSIPTASPFIPGSAYYGGGPLPSISSLPSGNQIQYRIYMSVLAARQQQLDAARNAQVRDEMARQANAAAPAAAGYAISSEGYRYTQYGRDNGAVCVFFCYMLGGPVEAPFGNSNNQVFTYNHQMFGFGMQIAAAEAEVLTFAAGSEIAGGALVGARGAAGLLSRAPAEETAAGSLAWQNPLYEAALERYGTSYLTNAGRALTKHPEVIGATKDTLRQSLRSDASINSAAQSALRNIIRNGVSTTPTLPRYGQVTQIQIPGGFGARWYADGRFIGFINP